MYHRSPQDLPHTVSEQKFNLSHPRSSHPYSSSEHFRSNSQEGHRLSYSGANSNDRVGPGVSGYSSSSVNLNPLPYSYGQSSGHGQSPLFGTDSAGSQGWQHRGSWIGGQDRLHAQKNQYSPPSSWSSPNESNSSTTSGTSNFFPTLNTPFYPNQSNNSPPFIATSTSHHSSSTSQYESVGGLQPREFGPRSFGSSSSSYSLGRDPFLQRTLPPMQLGYSSSQPLTSGNLAPSPASLWRD